MWMKKTIPTVLLLCLAGLTTSFADIIVHEDNYEDRATGSGTEGWLWANGACTHTGQYADYEGSIVREHTGNVNNSQTAPVNTRYGYKTDIAMSGNTSSDPADYTIELDIRNVQGDWDPHPIEIFVLTYNPAAGTGTYGYGLPTLNLAQADGWVHVKYNLADLTKGWWEGTNWDMTNPTWSYEIGGPPYPGQSVAVGESWTQVFLVDNLKITMISGPEKLATAPVPDDEATDVFYEPSLSWTPGEFADTHNVYLGTNFNDVNDADVASPLLVGPSLTTNSFHAGRLEFGQTYFWRVDEVNAPLDNTVFKGNVWSFTVETSLYTMTEDNITATASSQVEGEGPDNTINNSGLDANDLHSIIPSDMWATSEGQTGPVWIQYEFDKTYKLHEMLVWNYNGSSVLTWYGLKEVAVEYSTDGTNWDQISDVNEFTQATGKTGYASNTTVPFNGVAAKYVRITAISNWSDGLFDQYGLSEVRFLYIPANAGEPNPDNGATGVAFNTTLSWRPGRDAEEHQVYLSTDEQAIIDGTASATTVGQNSYGPLSLELERTYYWRIDEVNNAEATPIWPSNIWSFTTNEYIVVDDFESYNDIPAGEEGSNPVYLTWTDGYVEPPNVRTNGSTIGYIIPFEPSMEFEIVYGGSQSAPLYYDNSTTSSSVVTVSMDDLDIGRDWTKGGATILALWFYGDPNNATTEQMYVSIGSEKVLYTGDPNTLTTTMWTPWIIDLTSLGINLSNVTTLSIGFERTGTTGGLGMILLDEIRLYRIAPQATEEIWIEAEATDDPIEPPMMIYDDPDASGGQYIAVESGITSTGSPPSTGVAKYTFTVQGGVYKINGRVIAPTADDDSFWVQIPGATTQTVNNSSGWVLWNNIDSGDDWHWDVVHSSDDNYTEVEWTMAAGTYTLEIAYREDGALLDAITITRID